MVWREVAETAKACNFSFVSTFTLNFILSYTRMKDLHYLGVDVSSKRLHKVLSTLDHIITEKGPGLPRSGTLPPSTAGASVLTTRRVGHLGGRMESR